MKPTIIRLLLAISLMVSGLALILTILGTTMISFGCGGNVLYRGFFLFILTTSGLIPVLILGIVVYFAGMILLVTCGKAPKKPDQDAEGSDSPKE